ncbi:integral component of membrane [Ascochyta rabiei]|uniref:Integral component of membrane n=1 Tax=Didymella rabiei TaxID=5454 RepID=A0A163E4J7_DIDRA|nr:integral component of membrane [Ascochyta rabiei]
MANGLLFPTVLRPDLGVWLGLGIFFWLTLFVLSNAILAFNSILAISSALFVTWFTFGVANAQWIFLNWGDQLINWKNTSLALFNWFMILASAFLTVFGVFTSISDPNARPNVITPALFDPFSTSLHILSHQLHTLRLRAVVDEALSRPTFPSTSPSPIRSSLQRLSIASHTSTASGTWYFQGPHNTGASSWSEITASSHPPLETTFSDETSHLDDMENLPFEWDAHRTAAQYRAVPNTTTLDALLAAFAKAAARMLRLREAALWCPLTFCADDVDGFCGFDGTRASGVSLRASWRRALKMRNPVYVLLQAWSVRTVQL